LQEWFVLDDAWLTLGLAAGITGANVNDLVERFGSVERAVAASKEDLLTSFSRPRAAGSLQGLAWRIRLQCHHLAGLPLPAPAS